MSPHPLVPRSLFPPEGRAEAAADGSSSERQCGRCRRFFDEVADPVGVRHEWWLCAGCRTALFGASA